MVDTEETKAAREQFKICSPIFIALGDLTRQKLCMDLAVAGKEGLNVAQLAGQSILSRPAVSHHLKVLKDNGIIEPIKKGTQIFYRLRLKENLAQVKELILMVDKILQEEAEEGIC